MKEIRQCSSCGGFCKKSGCERANVEPDQRFEVAQKSWADGLREFEAAKYAADNYRRLLDESDHAFARMEDQYQYLLRVAIHALMDMDNGLVVHEGIWRNRHHAAISKIKEYLK